MTQGLIWLYLTQGLVIVSRRIVKYAAVQLYSCSKLKLNSRGFCGPIEHLSKIVNNSSEEAATCLLSDSLSASPAHLEQKLERRGMILLLAPHFVEKTGKKES